MFSTLRTYLEMIRFSHTVFALPFALMSAVLAEGRVPSGRTLGWILVAMVGARSGAMGMNRIADRRLDALNPRTRDRALPQGRISLRAAAVFVAVSFGLFLLAAWRLNPLCLALAPAALAVLVGYSYTKRFTTLSHLVLGLSLGIAPVGAWIAVTGGIALPPVLLCVAVLFWVAGFDILYAFADVEFDRQTGLWSIPARWGMAAGRWVSAAFHAITVACLAGLIPLLALGPSYTLGLGLAAALLATEHVLVFRHGLAKLDLAFFNVNGIVSVGMLLATLLDVGLRK
jgi:4-hydroxybenzoate polyprenyltransferase